MHVIPMNGSGEIPPEIWRCEEQDLPYARAILAAAGVNFDAADIQEGLADVHPAILSKEVLDNFINPAELAEYIAEMRAHGFSPAPDGTIDPADRRV